MPTVNVLGHEIDVDIVRKLQPYVPGLIDKAVATMMAGSYEGYCPICRDSGGTGECPCLDGKECVVFGDWEIGCVSLLDDTLTLDSGECFTEVISVGENGWDVDPDRTDDAMELLTGLISLLKEVQIFGGLTW